MGTGNNMKLGGLAIVSVCLLYGCIEDIDLNPGDAPKVVVNCLLKESDIQTMEIYYTSESLDGDRKPVENAKVLLSAYDEFVTEFQHDSGCMWSARYKPKNGSQYKLKVIVDGDTLSAQTRFPDDVQVCTYGRGRYADSSSRFGRDIYLYYSYELRVISNEIEITPGMTYSQISDYFIYGTAYRKACHLWIFPHNLNRGDYEHYIGTTHTKADNFNILPLYVKDLPCFSRDSIIAMESWVRERLAWYPKRLADIPMHDSFVRIDIPDNYDNGKTQEELSDTPVYSPSAFALAREFPIQLDSNFEDPYKAVLYDVYFLSDEADQYFKDVYQRNINKDNFVFEYDTDNVYSNINGGLGIFGAITMRENRHGIRGYLKDFSVAY